MRAQIGHIEAPAPVLGRHPRSAENDPKRRANRRGAWSNRPLSPRAPKYQAQQERGASASAAVADRSSGVLLLPLGAVLVMVADVIVVGAVGRLWILIPAIAVDLLVILTLTLAILRLLGDDGEDVPTTMPDERAVAPAMPSAAAAPRDHERLGTIAC
jgi:hypothetical protein